MPEIQIDRFNTKTAQKTFFMFFIFHVSLFVVFLAVLLLAVINFNVTAQSITWQKMLSENHGWFEKVQQASDGGYIAVGTGRVNNKAKIFLVKLDYLGETIWTKIIGVGENDGLWVEETTDKGFIIGGTSDSVVNPKAYLIKTDSLGNIQWHKTYQNSNLDQCYCVKQTLDGGYILACRTTPLFESTWFIKTDPIGNIQYQKVYQARYPEEVEIDNNGYISVGQISSTSVDIFVMKLNSQLDTIWSKRLGGNNTDVGYSIEKISNEGYIVGGFSQSYNSYGKSESYICRLDTNGNTIWSRTYSHNGSDKCFSLRYKPNVGYIAVGYSDSLNNSDFRPKMRILDFDGNVIYENSFFVPGTEGATFYSVEMTADGGFIAGGLAELIGSISRMYIAKTDSLLRSTPIGIINIGKNLSKEFKLYQNFPNPFNSSTNILFDIIKDSKVIIVIFNILGREIESILNEELKAGSYRIQWNASNFSSGIYFYRIETGNYIDAKKMVLIK